MGRKRVCGAVIAAALMASGCATNVGTQAVNDFGRYHQLQAGVTTKRQVHDLFGQPHAVAQIVETGESVWSYFNIRERTSAITYVPYVGMLAGGSDIDSVRADFYFDRNEAFLRSQREERSRYKNMWLGLGDAVTPSGEIARVRAEMERLGLPFDERQAALVAGWADAAD